MAYLAIKKKFVHLTGRFDLVQDLSVYASAPIFGIDDVIWSGQKLLESMVSDRKRELSWERQDISSGEIKVHVRNVRAIKEVWKADDDGKTLLMKKSLGWLRKEYGELSQLDNAAPKYWAPAINKLSPNQADLTSANYTNEFSYDADDIYFDDDDWSYDTILFYPPADGTYTISVLGKFWEKKLTDDADVNFWTERYEETLMTAGMMILERYARNRSGVAEHLANIEMDLKGIMDDFIDEEISGVNQQAG